MSAPVQNAFSPVPVTITTRTSGALSSAAQWASSASSIGTVSAFSFSGLSSRSSATGAVDGEVKRAHDAALIGCPASLLRRADATIGAGCSGSQHEPHRAGAEQARRAASSRHGARLTRPSDASTMSRCGSMPGMTSVATRPSSVSRITQRSVT